MKRLYQQGTKAKADDFSFEDSGVKRRRPLYQSGSELQTPCTYSASGETYGVDFGDFWAIGLSSSLNPGSPDTGRGFIENPQQNFNEPYQLSSIGLDHLNTIPLDTANSDQDLLDHLDDYHKTYHDLYQMSVPGLSDPLANGLPFPETIDNASGHNSMICSGEDAELIQSGLVMSSLPDVPPSHDMNSLLVSKILSLRKLTGTALSQLQSECPSSVYPFETAFTDTALLPLPNLQSGMSQMIGKYALYRIQNTKICRLSSSEIFWDSRYVSPIKHHATIYDTS